MTMINEPRKMVLRRPNQFPIQMVGMDPTKQPRLYAATAIPVESVALSSYSISTVKYLDLSTGHSSLPVKARHTRTLRLRFLGRLQQKNPAIRDHR